MKTNVFIKVLRKVIREEVRSAIQDEIDLLNEIVESKSPKKPFKENSSLQSILPPAKKTKTPVPSSPLFSPNNPLADLLNETYNSGEWRGINMNSGNVQDFSNEPLVVNSIDDMLANTRPAGDINAVQINAVPDFSALMSKMKENGQI
jgi:hypothetical protein